MSKPADEECNSELAIELAKPVAERWRDALIAAVNSSPETSWRSVDLQVAFLTGAIAEAIDSATTAERDRLIAAADMALLDFNDDGNDDYGRGYKFAKECVIAAIKREAA